MTEGHNALLNQIRLTRQQEAGNEAILRDSEVVYDNDGGWTAMINEGHWQAHWQAGFAAGLRAAASIVGIPFEDIYGSID